MPSKPFIGRKLELEKLRELRRKAVPSLIVVKGRRRIALGAWISQTIAYSFR